jgi:hypothetical protein
VTTASSPYDIGYLFNAAALAGVQPHDVVATAGRLADGTF